MPGLTRCSTWLVTLVVLGGLNSTSLGQPSNPSPATDAAWIAEKVNLTSGPLLPRLRIPGDTNRTGISLIRIDCRDLSATGGNAEVTFDRSELQFDEFGDATIVPPPKTAAYAVTLESVDVADYTGEGRHLFAVRFTDGGFRNRLYLVLSPGPITRDRLLVVAGDAPPPDLKERVMPHFGRHFVLDQLSFEQVVPLETTGDRQWLQPLSRVEPLHLISYRFRFPGADRQVAIEFSGRAGMQGLLSKDPNYVQYGPFGDVELSTLMGYQGRAYEVKERQVRDPAGRNRYLLDLLPAETPSIPGLPPVRRDDPRRYTLVVSPTSDDSDRLLIYEEGRLTHAIPLVEPRRSGFLRQCHELAGAPEELELIDRARTLIGNRFGFSVEEGHVSRLNVSGDGVTADALNLFVGLPRLRSLSLNSCRGPNIVDILQPLGRFQQIEDLSFRLTPINDPVLQEVGRLTHLQTLSIYDELPPNTSPESVLHVTDQGLAALASLTELTRLDLYGPGISDTAFQHLDKLPKLDSLRLHRTAATVKGLVSFVRQKPSTRVELQMSVPRTPDNPEDRSLSFSVDRAKRSASISGELASDDRLVELCELSDLTAISVDSRSITDQGLSALSKLHDLESLSVNHNRAVTNDGLQVFAELPRLQKLNLWYCENLDDGAIESLSALKGLTELNLGGTHVTEAGVGRLHAGLPGCKIRTQ